MENNVKKQSNIINIFTILGIVILIILLYISSLTNKDNNLDIASNNINNNESTIVINMGDNYIFNNDIEGLSWTTSNKEIATIDELGNLTAINQGEVIITAHKEEKIIYEYKIKVEENNLNTLELTTKNITLPVNDTYKLDFTTQIKNNDFSNLIWTSSNEEIATVKDGIITTKSPGTTKITVSTPSNVTTSCNVTVITDIKIEKIEFSQNNKTIIAGEEYQSKIIFTPSNLSSNIEYKSSNEEVATVNNSGLIKGLKEGTTTISANVGEISTNITITVNKNPDKTVVISFDKNGATEISSIKEGCNSNGNGCQIELPNITREGYKILGWSKDDKTTIPEYKPHETITVYHDTTYYAITSKDIILKFNANGANISNTTSSCQIYNKEEICQITTPTITRNGYNIVGWNTKSNATNSQVNQNTKINIDKDSEYYAITSKKLTATFNANGANISNTNKECTIYNTDSSCKITTPTITRNGYNIIGWNSEATATSSQVNPNANINIDKDSEYYAITSKKLTATFNANGANMSNTNKECTIYNTNSSCKITTPTITRNGYNIIGWNSEATVTSSQVNPNANISIDKDSKYYAITSKKLTATFNANNSTISKTSDSCTIYNTNTHCNITTPSISRENYLALGWGSSADTSKVILQDNKQVAISEPANYYAITKINVDGIEKGCTGWMTINGKYYSSASTSSSSSSIAVGTVFTIEEVIGNFFKISIPNVSGYKYIEHKYVMINLADYIPSMAIDISNANASIFKSSGYTIPNVTGTKLYSTGKIYNIRLRKNEYMVPTLYPVAKKILATQRTLLSQGYSIKAYDTYRPRSVSTKIYNSLTTLYNNNSTVRNNILYSYGLDGTRYTWGKGWFLAASVSHHNVGAAIDMTLVYKSTGKEVVMPTAMHELSAKAIKYYSPSVSRVPANYAKEMNDVAKIMDSAAINAGLTTLSSEWWHFEDNVSYKAVLAKQSNGCDFHVNKIYSY